jgi:hypothetical protein
MELKAELEARGIRIYNGCFPGTARTSRWSGHLRQGVLGDLGKAQRRGVIGTVRTRFRKKGKAAELLVDSGDDAAATLVITSDTPDEARLAVLDLDLTAEDVRGQFLRWDAEAETWRPSDTED